MKQYRHTPAYLHAHHLHINVNHTQIKMKTFFKNAVLYCMLLAGTPCVCAQPDTAPDGPGIVFRFVKGKDMFYVPWKGNGARLDSLCLMVEPERLETGSIHVDGYGPSKGLVKIRCNRVKSELILRRGVREEHFTTTNRIGAFNGMHDVVVVTLPAIETGPEVQPTGKPETERQVQAVQPTVTAEPQHGETTADGPGSSPAPDMKDGQAGKDGSPSQPRWTIGLNAGIPFFWGDMVSLSADKKYMGFAAGIQGGYRFSRLLAVSLSVDYAQGKLGARDYARDYLLAPDGMTWYVPQAQDMRSYKDLYAKVSLVNVGLGLDVNLNRIFGKKAAERRFTVWLSPAVYAQFFDADVYTKDGGNRYSDGTTQPDNVSLGLGGALALRYRIARNMDIQLKNSLFWMTDNLFDGIRTIYGETRHNAAWIPQIGFVWGIR